MSGGSKNDIGESVTSSDTETTKKTKQNKGVLSRVWNAVFRPQRDDFEKRLQHISKEEAAVLARITRRSNAWRRTTKRLIVFSILLEVVAVGYAIVTTRTTDLDWKTRALRVLPMFLLPPLCFITYSALRSFNKMCDKMDHDTVEKLRAERQAKIDELKEKTNYYITQQLIQRYDPDPAAKAAAASVLASKLGADSGLKVYLGDDSKANASTGKSSDVEVSKTAGLRNRRPSLTKSHSTEIAASSYQTKEMLGHSHTEFDGGDMSQQQHPMVVEHRPQVGPNGSDGGWVARLAALLVGEDPTQSYALICGNCHMHNGLARKEDYPYITYYCPHCKALNRSNNKQSSSGERVSTSDTPNSLEPNLGESEVVERIADATDSAIVAAAVAQVVPQT